MSDTTADKLSLLNTSKKDIRGAINNRLSTQSITMPEETPLSEYDVYIKMIQGGDYYTVASVEDLSTITNPRTNALAVVYDKTHNSDFVDVYIYQDSQWKPVPNVYTATANKILSGETALGALGPIEGSMPNNGTLTITPTTSQQSIPAGYTSGGTVEAVTASVDPNIVQSNIKAGVTILGVQGNVVPDKPDQTKSVTPTTSQQIIEPDTGYELASVTVNGVTSDVDANIVPENIKSGTTILGVTGNYIGTDTSDATAVPLDIKSGETAYVDGQKITGTLPCLTYPINPARPSDTNYQFIAATAGSTTTRDGTDYLVGTYQIAAQNEPDSWMFEGNRKMKLGIPYSLVRSKGGITASKIMSGYTIYGVAGTAQGIPTGYVRSGLTNYYDAILNNYGSHSSSTTSWQDIKGGNNLTLTGSPTWTSNSLELPGGSYASSASTMSFNQEFTIEYRGKWTSGSGGWAIFVGAFRWGFGFSDYNPSTGNVRYTYGNDKNLYNQPLGNMSVPYTLTITSDANGMYIYKNGTLMFSSPALDYSLPLSKTFYLNMADWENAGQITHSVNSIRVYNRKLTANEIKANHTYDLIRYCT